MEKWRDYPDFIGEYQVSNLSRIRNLKTGKILKPHLHHSNYYTICFKRSGQKPKYLSRARVIAITWIPNPENKKEVNHINGVTTDDRIVNLEWATPSENILHYYYKLDKGAKREVIQMDMNGNELKRWPSISMAVKSLNNPKASMGNVVTVCKGKNHYAYGFKWKYAE
jgi:hypothetical protein